MKKINLLIVVIFSVGLLLTSCATTGRAGMKPAATRQSNSGEMIQGGGAAGGSGATTSGSSGNKTTWGPVKRK